MADTVRTESQLLTSLFQDGQADGAITSQDIRDLIVSVKTINPELITGLANPAHQEGKIFYDDEHKAVSYYNENSDVTVNIGQELLLRIINTTGGTIEDGTIVYVSGASSELPKVTKAIASTNTPEIIGVATNEILDDEIGYICISGLVHSINTSSYTAGDLVYLSSSVAGGITNTAPTLPIETIQIGTVLDSATDGHLFVRPRRINYSYETTVTGQFRSLVTQTAAMINTAYPVALEVDGVKENITHSTTVDNNALTMEVDGMYAFTAEIQVYQGSGGGARISAWFQHDHGAGWVDTPDVAIIDLGNATAGFLGLTHVGRHDVNDKIRIMWATDNVNGELTAFGTASPVPATPSVTLIAQKIGSV